MIEYLVFVTAFISLFGAMKYIHSMFKGGAKPNRMTWFMWTAAPFISTAAAVSTGVGWSVLPVFMSGFTPFLILLSSFFIRGAYWKLKRFDYVCGVLSASAIVLWVVTSDPNIAIILSISSGTFATIPTLMKTWRHPETESSAPYVLGLVCTLSSFTSMTMWTFSEYAFPVYLVINTVIMIFAVYRKRIFGIFS